MGWRERVALEEGDCLDLLALLGEVGAPLALRIYERGDVVYRAGEEGRALYVLTRGVARLFARHRNHAGSKDATLLLLGPGDVFGYPVFAWDGHRRVSAGAVTGCEVLKIPSVFVERALLRRPELAPRMVALLEARLVEYGELVGCLLPRETEVRLARMLPILARKFGERTGDGRVTIGHRFTRSDLAEMTASTRESVTAAMIGLEERGILATERGRITILDSGMLARIAGP